MTLGSSRRKLCEMPWKREPVSQRGWPDLSIEVPAAISRLLVEFRARGSPAVETAAMSTLPLGSNVAV